MRRVFHDTSSAQSGTFLDNTKNHEYSTADVVMLGVACDLTASYRKGSRHGPKAIVNASYQAEYATPGFYVPLTDRVRIHNKGIIQCPNTFDDDGSLHSFRPGAIEQHLEDMVDMTKEMAVDTFKDGKKLMLFGGDHSVPNGVWHAISELYDPKKVTVLQIDGHLDLRDELDGTKYSHACIMRRAREKGFQVLQVGPRDHVSEEEAKYISNEGISKDIYFCATQPQIFYDTFSGKINSRAIEIENLIFNGKLNREQRSSLYQKVASSEHLWITIDVDGFSAHHTPGTGTPLPFGLRQDKIRDFLYGLIRVIHDRDIRLLGFDINEVAPQQQKNGIYSVDNSVSTMDEMNAALLAYNLLFWEYIDRFISA